MQEWYYKNNQKQIKIKNLLIKGLKDYQFNDNKFRIDEMKNYEDEIISDIICFTDKRRC